METEDETPPSLLEVRLGFARFAASGDTAIAEARWPLRIVAVAFAAAVLCASFRIPEVLIAL